MIRIQLAGAVLGFLAGVGAAWLTTSLHLISPANVLAGMGMGMGGVFAGYLLAVVITWRRYL